jgi:hypothetical protein
MVYFWLIDSAIINAYTVEGSLRASCQPIVSLDEQDECDCVAFRKWNLPCQHMLELWIFVGTDLEPNWERYSSTFDDAMFDIYEAQKVVIQQIEAGQDSQGDHV